MSDPVPITYDQMQTLLTGQANTFANALKNQGSSSPPPSSGGGGGSVTAKNAQDVNSAVGSMIQGFERAGKGASSVGEVLNGVSAGLGKVNVLGVQQGFDAMKNSVIDTTNMQKAFVNSGLLSAGQTADWGKRIAGTGGDVESFKSQVQRYSQSLGGIASTNEGTAKELAAFQKDFRDSKVGKTLESMGFVPEKLNEIATNALIRQQGLGLSEEKARKEAIKQVGEFTMSMLGAANATNKNTDQLMRENQVRSEDLDVQLALLDGGKEMNQAYQSLKKSTSDLGSELQGSLDEIFAQGVITEKAGQNLSALGTAGTQLGEAALQLRNAKTEEQRKEAEQRLAAAKNNADAYMRSKEFRQTAQSQKYQDDPTGQAMRRIAAQEMTRLQLQSTGGQQLGQQGPATAGQIQTVKDFQQAQMAQAATGRDATGKKGEGTELYQNIVAADIGMRNEYNKLVVKGYEKFSGAVDEFSKSVLMMPGAKAAKTGQATETTSSTAKPPRPPLERRLEGSPGLNDLTNNIKQETAGVPKGWMEVLEKFDPKGEAIQVDGEEVVVNKKQWTTIGESLNSKLSSSSSKKKEPSAPVPKGMPADIQKQMESIAGKMSESMPNAEKEVDTALKSLTAPEADIGKAIEGKMTGFKMPDISEPFEDAIDGFKMPDISKTIDDVAGKFGPDMFKPLTSGISDIFGPMSNISMPNPQEMFGGLKNSVASMSSEFGTKQTGIDTTPEAGQSTSPSAIPAPNQDMLAGLLEKLNTSVAGMGGLLQEGNQIAQSGNNQLASAADNRFTIG